MVPTYRNRKTGFRHYVIISGCAHIRIVQRDLLGWKGVQKAKVDLYIECGRDSHKVPATRDDLLEGDNGLTQMDFPICPDIR